MAGGELRRSYTQMDFSLNRVNIRPQMPQFFHQQPSMQVRDPRRRFSAMPSNKPKHPTIGIYRPPSVRHEGAQNGMAMRSLNVHAPEFTMNKIQPSRSTSSVMMNGYSMMAGPGYGGKGPFMGAPGKDPVMAPLQQSKSSGNVLHMVHPSVHPPNNIQQMAPRAVHFQEPPAQHKGSGTSLKRSKSLSATDTMRGSSPGGVGGDLGVGTFTVEVQKDLHQAIKDPNEMLARSLMTLANVIVERAISDRRYAEPAAKICINVIEKEKKETFLESLLNTCQLSYQERDKLLRNTATGSRYRQYMTFLNEMYVQLKRSQLQLKTHYDGVPPQKLLLTLLSKSFIDCLQAKTLSKIEEAISKGENKEVENIQSGEKRYVMVHGPVKALGNNIPSMYVPNTFGVVQKMSTNEHVVSRTSSGYWLNESHPIHQSYSAVPFAIIVGNSLIEVKDVLLADELQLDTVYNKYDPTVHSLAANLWSFFSGIRRYGLETTEEMLKEGTVVTGVGELALLEDGSKALLPSESNRPYLITTQSIATLLNGIKEKKTIHGSLLMITGTVTFIFGALLLRRLWTYLKKKKEQEDLHRRLTERRRKARTPGENVPEALQCVVCQENPREVIMLPCGHLCACEDCSERLGPKCPICRAHITTKAAAFLS